MFAIIPCVLVDVTWIDYEKFSTGFLGINVELMQKKFESKHKISFQEILLKISSTKMAAILIRHWICFMWEY